MRRIPEKYELSEEDIKEALRYWLRSRADTRDKDFDIEFSVDRVAVARPPGAPVGGMSDFTKQAITAVAVTKKG